MRKSHVSLYTGTSYKSWEDSLYYFSVPGANEGRDEVVLGIPTSRKVLHQLLQWRPEDEILFIEWRQKGSKNKVELEFVDGLVRIITTSRNGRFESILFSIEELIEDLATALRDTSPVA